LGYIYVYYELLNFYKKGKLKTKTQKAIFNINYRWK